LGVLKSRPSFCAGFFAGHFPPFLTNSSTLCFVLFLGRDEPSDGLLRGGRAFTGRASFLCTGTPAGSVSGRFCGPLRDLLRIFFLVFLGISLPPPRRHHRAFFSFVMDLVDSVGAGSRHTPFFLCCCAHVFSDNHGFPTRPRPTEAFHLTQRNSRLPSFFLR